MKVTIDLGKLLEFYDKNGKEYDIDCGDGFRAFILDFVCGEMKETSTETNSQYCRLVLDGIQFKTRDTAEQVLEKMKARADARGFVTIADYYRFANNKDIERTMHNWGWRDMKGTYIYSYSYYGTETWGIRFPDAMRFEHD